MKIASVSFFGEHEYGGAQTAAKAFFEHCHDIGHNTTLFLNPQNIELDYFDDQDLVFFSSPPRKDFPFDLSFIKYKFVFMMHDETDVLSGKYPQYKEMLNHEYCVGFVHIDIEGNLYDNVHKNIIKWQPCALPYYLNHINGNKILSQKESIAFAGRIVEWKNPKAMLDFCRNNEYDYNFYGKNYTDESIFNKAKPFKAMSEIAIDNDLFWDICGTEENKMEVKRINLTSWEAFHAGMMPIVDINSIPEKFKGIFIEIDRTRGWRVELKDKILNYRTNKYKMYTNALKKVEELKMLDEARSRVLQILNSVHYESDNNLDIQETKSEVQSVDQILHSAADLFESKNKEYGDAYRTHPKIMHMLLGEIQLKTPEDFERYTRISSIIAKLNRYCANWSKGGHEDSARDLVVFSAMLKELHQD